MSATSPRKAAIRSATDSKITKAVLELIRTDGLDAVTIDNVALQSGVAKTTIYRRHKDRFEMMAAVASQLSEGVLADYPHTRAGLTALIADMQRIFEEDVGLRAVGALLASPSTSLQEWRDRLVSPSLAALEHFFSSGVQAGVLTDAVDYDQVIEMIVGGMFVCEMLRGDVPDDWGSGLAALVWPTIAVR